MDSAEAQDRFSQLLESAQREPVAITRDGQPTAFLVSPRDMEELLDARRKRSQALSDLEAWSSRVRGMAGPAASSLTDEHVTRMVHEER